MKFENVSSQKSGRSIVIDFRMINIHTGLYVRQSREEANRIIGVQHSRVMIARACPRNSISATERTMDFHIVERVLDLS
jgi:hypothetical protein